MNITIDKLTIDINCSIGNALKQMDSILHKLLIVSKNGKYFSMLSVGDIQRAIIRGMDLNTRITDVLRERVTIASVNDDINSIKKHMLERRNEYMPLVTADGTIQKVLFWEELFSEKNVGMKNSLNTPVLLMAGGIGSRLRPLTNVLPKALIPIGEKSIIEQIIDSFVEYGCRDYIISVNYKADMIKYYMENIAHRGYNVTYIEEQTFLGTAGSIRLAQDKISSTFFVSNCDIMVDQDYSEILSFHRCQQNEITLVAALLNINVPYGVLNTDSDGQLMSISEKPEFFYKINTGLYILEPTVFPDIPENEFFHITDLIEKLVKQDRKVGVFPVSEKSWTDMGNWNEFLKRIHQTP